MKYFKQYTGDKLQSDPKTYFNHVETMIVFSAQSSNREIVLKLVNSNRTHPASSYELVIGGGDEHDVTWLSIIGKNQNRKTRIKTAYTPNILSQHHPSSFWISIGSNATSKSQNKRFIQFGRLHRQKNPIITWPVENSFAMNEIFTKQLAGNILNIR